MAGERVEAFRNEFMGRDLAEVALWVLVNGLFRSTQLYKVHLRNLLELILPTLPNELERNNEV